MIFSPYFMMVSGMLSMVVTCWIKFTDRDDVLRRKNANQMDHDQHDETKQIEKRKREELR